MLQWMGGSRRKVTASRRSTQKRQKQYFEQRKRQQQQQKAGIESYPEGINSGNHHKEHRSLDILSLMNLSTVAQEGRSSCPTESRTLEVDVPTMSYEFSKGQTTNFTNSVSSAGSVEIKEAGNASRHRVDSVSPKKVSFNARDDYDDASDVIGGKMNHLKSSNHPVTILDLLGDDGFDDKLEVRRVTEDHVAFSVEGIALSGLGNVGAETPVHSPKQCCRIKSYGCSSPLKAARRLQSFGNFHCMRDDIELEVDAMMQDINMSLSSNSLRLPSYSRGMTDPFSNKMQKLSTVDDCLQLEDYSSKMSSSYGDRKFLCDGEEDKENIWIARSSFLEDHFLDERVPRDGDGNSVDTLKFRNHELSDFAFVGPHICKTRDRKKAKERFNILDSSPPCYGLESENDEDFLTSDLLRYPMAGKAFDYRDFNNGPDVSYFAMEDPGDTFSSLSEESCSSSAVRGGVTINSPSMAKKSLRSHGKKLSGPQCGVKKVGAREVPCKDRDDVQQGGKACGIGMFTRMSNPSQLKAPHHTNFIYQNKLALNNSSLLEEVCPSADINLGFSSFCQTSETTYASSDCNLWTEDPFDGFSIPKLDINAKSSIRKSKHDVPFEYSHPGGYFSEIVALSPVLSEVEIGLPTDIYSNFEEEIKPRNSSYVAGSYGNFEHCDLPLQEPVTDDQDEEPQNQSTDSSRCDIEKEHCSEPKGFSSENEHKIDYLDAKDYGSECQKATDESPELLEKTAGSSENAELSSSAKVPDNLDPDNLECSIVGEACHPEAETWLTCQDGNKEPEVDKPEVRKRVSGGQSNSGDPSHHVMMLQSFFSLYVCRKV